MFRTTAFILLLLTALPSCHPPINYHPNNIQTPTLTSIWLLSQRKKGEVKENLESNPDHTPHFILELKDNGRRGEIWISKQLRARLLYFTSRTKSKVQFTKKTMCHQPSLYRRTTRYMAVSTKRFALVFHQRK